MPDHEAPAMQRRSAQFTIQGLMIAVAIVAGLLALPGGWRVAAAALSVPCLAVLAARRLFLGRSHRLAAITFWGLALPVNVLFAALSVLPGMHSFVLLLIWLFVILPTLLAFGTTWAAMSTRREGVPHPSRRWVWSCFIALAVMPGVTAWTTWPFHLTFLTARPALDTLADQIEAGEAVSFPQTVGLFRLVGSRLDSRTGGVALLTDPNPSGPSGFVRHKISYAGPYGCFGPIRGDWWHVSLGGGWCYHEED
jgi:hypothetical protein